ncbi:MAG: DUF3685 domain-containing protein [Nostocaceae cyanobacterium]|nr:DUF3685 domain-containing protein [Nostocaceae cyanobacterium]
MSDRRLKLLLIDPDPIFQLGLRFAVAQIADVQIVESAEIPATALQILADRRTDGQFVNLIVLEVVLDIQSDRYLPGMQLCRQLKILYPNLPIFLLSSLTEPDSLAAIKALGVNGYCPKGTAVSEIVAAMRQVAAGGFYWYGEKTEKDGTKKNHNLSFSSPTPSPPLPSPLRTLLHQLRLSGFAHINTTLAAVTAELQVPGIPLMEKAILAGQRRELLAARWLLSRLLPSVKEVTPIATSQLSFNDSPSLPVSDNAPITIFTATAAKLQFPLQNLTDEPLEIDIFREDKKRELFYLILRKIESILEELRFSQVEISELPSKSAAIIKDLWQITITDFLGRYSTIKLGDRYLEIVELLLLDKSTVQTAILSKIPLLTEFLAYVLFQSPLMIDHLSYEADTPEAIARAELLLHNLLIQIANGVVQPLLNQLADLEVIKQNFYDRNLLSTREIERFRNSLSWKYRFNNYITEPVTIFESRYNLLVFAPRGIAKITIYAPRGQELAKLSGIRLLVTLVLEIRDALAPRLQAVVTFLGKGLVYILTQVIGQAIGLIGRGILQGIGNISLREKK